MMRFVFSGFLLRYVAYQRSLDYPDTTGMQDGLDRLFRDHPDLRPLVIDEEGHVRPTVRLCVDGEIVRGQDVFDCAVQNSTTIEMLTAVAGG
ncbi:MoaD/ThiS family protein [Streptomyces sp. BE230]|uniref:MoaD/ThiS family protein n=1 Tax=Streptomyces sp. BE230 TaxID=3002526 RepID=UPI002ED1D5EE|nr:MoaD/ThiS family protein [Streptomyces sp. BE230]